MNYKLHVLVPSYAQFWWILLGPLVANFWAGHLLNLFDITDLTEIAVRRRQRICVNGQTDPREMDRLVTGGSKMIWKENEVSPLFVHWSCSWKLPVCQAFDMAAERWQLAVLHVLCCIHVHRKLSELRLQKMSLTILPLLTWRVIELHPQKASQKIKALWTSPC